MLFVRTRATAERLSRDIEQNGTLNRFLRPVVLLGQGNSGEASSRVVLLAAWAVCVCVQLPSCAAQSFSVCSSAAPLEPLVPVPESGVFRVALSQVKGMTKVRQQTAIDAFRSDNNLLISTRCVSQSCLCTCRRWVCSSSWCGMTAWGFERFTLRVSCRVLPAVARMSGVACLRLLVPLLRVESPQCVLNPVPC